MARALSVKKKSATPWMMLTSVSSMFITVESSSRRLSLGGFTDATRNHSATGMSSCGGDLTWTRRPRLLFGRSLATQKVGKNLLHFGTSTYEQIYCRIHRNFLPRLDDRLHRNRCRLGGDCTACNWRGAHGHGLRRRPHLGRALQPGGNAWRFDSRPAECSGRVALHRVATLGSSDRDVGGEVSPRRD